MTSDPASLIVVNADVTVIFFPFHLHGYVISNRLNHERITVIIRKPAVTASEHEVTDQTVKGCDTRADLNMIIIQLTDQR